MTEVTPAQEVIEREQSIYSSGLVGRCFVIFGDCKNSRGQDMVDRQGIVRAYLPEGRILVQYFEPMFGEQSTLAVYELSAIPSGSPRTSGAWEFFVDDEHLRFWLDHWGKSRFTDDFVQE